MGQFSVTILAAAGSNLSGNQHDIFERGGNKAPEIYEDTLQSLQDKIGFDLDNSWSVAFIIKPDGFGRK